jgi:hypothetical protein
MSSQPQPGHLTDEEARTLTRHQILGRVEEEQSYLLGKRRRTAADNAKLNELGRILIAYLPPGKALDALDATLRDGHRSGYWDSRPCDDDQPGGGGL